jgi:hypothetical protein
MPHRRKDESPSIALMVLDTFCREFEKAGETIILVEDLRAAIEAQRKTLKP